MSFLVLTSPQRKRRVLSLDQPGAQATGRRIDWRLRRAAARGNPPVDSGGRKGETTRMIRTRRWNDPKKKGDGMRLLVCRYRPRALPKSDETWDLWWSHLGPSK